MERATDKGGPYVKILSLKEDVHEQGRCAQRCLHQGSGRRKSTSLVCVEAGFLLLGWHILLHRKNKMASATNHWPGNAAGADAEGDEQEAQCGDKDAVAVFRWIVRV